MVHISTALMTLFMNEEKLLVKAIKGTPSLVEVAALVASQQAS